VGGEHIDAPAWQTRREQNGQEQLEVHQDEGHGCHLQEHIVQEPICVERYKGHPNETEPGDQPADSTQTAQPPGSTWIDKELGESHKEKSNADSPHDQSDQKQQMRHQATVARRSRGSTKVDQKVRAKRIAWWYGSVMVPPGYTSIARPVSNKKQKPVAMMSRKMPICQKACQVRLLSNNLLPCCS